MRCDEARLATSARLDGETDHDDAAPTHMESCPGCRAWLDQVAVVRRALRFEVMGVVPDVAPSVLAHLPARQRRRPQALLPALAAMVAGMVIGAVLVSGIRPGEVPTPVQADIPRQVAAAQVELRSMEATVEVRERGWHRDVPLRTYRGHLAYRAPESVSLQLTDTTEYPSGAWPSNDVTMVLDGATYWQRGLFACPADAQPACTPASPRIRAVSGREPFAPEGADLLELTLPTSGFEVGETASIREGRKEIGGREAVGVLTVAAQLDGFLAGLRQAGNWREIHPTDAVELWLDTGSLVPLAVDVTVAGGVDRERWATARGYADEPGMVILSIGLDRLIVNQPVPDSAFAAVPAGVRTVDAGFRDAAPSDVATPEPRWLPPGMNPARMGVVNGGSGPRLAIRTWTDDRAWVKVRSTSTWPGGRLFGDLGPAPRRLDLGEAGIAYAGEAGDRVGLHSPGLDVVVTGSLPLPVLERVAASLGVHGEPVPPTWAEAGAGTLPPWALLLDAPSGFTPPSVYVRGAAVTLSFAGPGARSFRITQEPGAALGPPVGSDVRGVRVRGSTGRYSPSLGLLEWVDGSGRVVGIQSGTMPLAELVDVAERLRVAQ